MSNPAVVKLQQKNIGRSRVWLDDNFGESIHIHIDDIRADLSVKEFEKICNDLCTAINNLVMIDGFDCNKIDPIYLEVMLWKDLPHLVEVKKDTVRLSKLLAPGRNGIASLPDSRAVKALRGDKEENNGERLSHHIGEDSDQRLDRMKNSIIQHGYPWEDNYIILYGSDNIIRDGQHRAACLYVLDGDIEVPVIRFFFDNYEAEKIQVSRNKFTIYRRRIIRRLREFRNMKDFYKACRHYGHKLKAQKRKRDIIKVRKKNETLIMKAEKVFANK